MIIQLPPFIIHRFTRISSTNDLLKEMADAPEFTCVVADEQTAGRGRRDRTWHSSPGDGLYLSVLLRPTPSTTKIPLLSLMTAVAVAETMIGHGVNGVDIKWPNDVLINGRKLCGILVEGVSGRAGETRIIIGIGVNLNHQNFPEEIGLTASSIRMETNQRVAVDEFRDQLLFKLAEWHERWKSGEEPLILDRWQQLSSYARDCLVTVTLDQELIEGRTVGLSADGALMVQTNDGRLRTVLAGEVSRLRKCEATELKPLGIRQQ